MDDWVGKMMTGRTIRIRPRGKAPRRTTPYEGRGSLTGLLPVTAGDLEGCEPQTTMKLVAKLARALCAERRRGRAGLASYDPERHLRLCAAYVSERRQLRRLWPFAPGKAGRI